jgi:hypothetical protein
VRVQHLAGSANNLNCHFPHELVGGYLGPLQERGTESVTNFACRNRLLHSDNFNNAAWTKTNVTATANQAEDPAGAGDQAALYLRQAKIGRLRRHRQVAGQQQFQPTCQRMALRRGDP